MPERGVAAEKTSLVRRRRGPSDIGVGTLYRRRMEVKYELSDYVRVLKLASRPEWEEFSQVSKIAGAGVFLVGLVGFLIYVVMFFVTGGI